MDEYHVFILSISYFQILKCNAKLAHPLPSKVDGGVKWADFIGQEVTPLYCGGWTVLKSQL